jgi:hypothetical protein
MPPPPAFAEMVTVVTGLTVSTAVLAALPPAPVQLRV